MDGRNQRQDLLRRSLEDRSGHRLDPVLLHKCVQQLMLIHEPKLQQLGAEPTTGPVTGLESGVKFSYGERAPIQQNFPETLHGFKYSSHPPTHCGLRIADCRLQIADFPTRPVWGGGGGCGKVWRE